MDGVQGVAEVMMMVDVGDPQVTSHAVTDQAFEFRLKRSESMRSNLR